MRELVPADLEGSCGFALSRDGKTLISTHHDRLLVWDAATGQVVRTIAQDVSYSRSSPGEVALSPDGRTLAVQRGDNKVRLVDFATGTPLVPEPEAHTGDLRSVDFTPDGRVLATSSNDGTIRLWDAATGAHRKRLDLGVQGWPLSVRVSPDGATLAVSGEYSAPGSSVFRGIVRLWGLPDGRLRRELKFDHRATTVTFARDGRRVAVTTWNAEAEMGGFGKQAGGPDNTIHVFDAQEGKKLAELRGHAGKILATAFAPDGATLVSASQDETFRFWDLATGRERRQLGITGHTLAGPLQAGKQARLTAAAFAPDLKTAITSGGGDDRLIVWNLSDGRAVRTLRVDRGRGAVLAVSPDGRLFASASPTSEHPSRNGATIRLWDVASGREVQHLETQAQWLWALAFAPDGRSLASAMPDSTALIWDVRAAADALARPAGDGSGGSR